MRKIILLLAVVLGIGVVGGLGWWYARASTGSHSPFRTEEAKREDLLASFSATGTLEPEDIIDVGTQVAGQIKEFGTDDKTSKAIDYGSDVDAGAVLAKIDDSLYVAKRNQSKAMVDVAKAAYAQALAKVDDAKANVKVQQAQLDSDQVNYDHSKRDWDRAQILSGKQALAQVAADVVGGRSYALVEALAGRLAEALLVADARLEAVEVTVRKLRPPLPLNVASTGVRVHRERPTPGPS